MHITRGTRGQAVVEFVLLFPLVIGLVLAIIEFGFVMYAVTTVNGAAREAARFGAVANEVGDSCQVDTITGRAVEFGGGTVECDEIEVEFVDRDSDLIAGRGDGVVVRIVHEYTMITPLGSLWEAFSFGELPSTFDINTCAASRLEAPSQEPTPVWGASCS